MRRRKIFAPILIAFLTSTPASASAPASAPAPALNAVDSTEGNSTEIAPVETFNYQDVGDRNMRVTVNSVATRGHPDYIPRASNWIQINVTIANISPRILTVSQIQGRLAGGSVYATASAFDNLLREPTANQQLIRGTTATAGGMAAGMLVFPPAAAIVAVGSMITGFVTRGRRERLERVFRETALSTGAVAPGTNISGNIYLPALRGHDGFILFYTTNAGAEALSVPRVATR